MAVIVVIVVAVVIVFISLFDVQWNGRVGMGIWESGRLCVLQFYSFVVISRGTDCRCVRAR